MDIDEQNGRHVYACPIAKDWAEARRKLDELHMGMSSLLKNAEHLSKLDELSKISGYMYELKEKTLDIAVNKDQAMTRFFLKTASMLFLALVGIIVYLLTGEHFGFVPPHR